MNRRNFIDAAGPGALASPSLLALAEPPQMRLSLTVQFGAVAAVVTGSWATVTHKQDYFHWPVGVKAAPKKGFLHSLEWSRDHCASRQAFARGSPECQRRMNSVINWLLAISLTFQWLAG
jgi:hypothetical protein